MAIAYLNKQALHVIIPTLQQLHKDLVEIMLYLHYRNPFDIDNFKVTMGGIHLSML